MAITVGSLIDVTLRFTYFQQAMMLVHTYAVFELVGIPNAANYGEAWWNHVKAAYRALPIVTLGDTFSSVVVRELNNPAGELGEFDIPVGERAGTRAAPTNPDPLPSFCAVGVRLTVATRATRPGQKRFPFLTESDTSNGQVAASYKSLITTLSNTLTAGMVLGAPAVGATLNPIVARRDTAGVVTAQQVVTGYVINSQITTQNTRKIGRGI